MYRARQTVSGIVLLTAMTVSSAAFGEAADNLAAGRSLWRSFEYEDAISTLRSVVTDPGATPSQRLEALELTAVLHMALRRPAQARQTFEQLLNLDPRHELTDPGYPPAVQQLYTETRSSFIHQAGVSVAPNIPETMPDGPTVPLAMTLSGQTQGVERAVVFVRSPGEPNFRRATMRRNGLEFSADVPAPAGNAALEYYIEAQAPSGFVLASLGTDTEPGLIQPNPNRSTGGWETPPDAGPGTDDPGDDGGEGPIRPRRAWYRSWWFWTIVGVAVAGGAAAGLAVGLQPEDEPVGTLGRENLP